MEPFTLIVYDLVLTQDRKLAEPQSSQVSPANQHDCSEETSHSGESEAAEFQEPAEPVEKPPERSLSDSGETHVHVHKYMKVIWSC